MKANEFSATSIKAERLQTRAVTNSEYVEELAERMTAGDIFPPIVIFTDGTDEWLADGIHRLDAAAKAKKKIGVDRRSGSRSDAVEFACGANSSRGLRPTRADKRWKVKMCLKAFPERSSRSIAELCGVSNHLVDEVRIELATGSLPKMPPPNKSGGNSPTCHDTRSETRTGKDGKQYPTPSKKPSHSEPTFDTKELDKQSRRSCGKERHSPAAKKAAFKALGVLIRALDQLHLSAEAEGHLKAINQIIKDAT